MSPQTQTSNFATAEKLNDREIVVERTFNASRDRVWRAFSEPELVAQWWGRGNNVKVERFEFRVGGHWRFVEHADGQTHGFEGRYREINPKDLIEHTFEWDGMPGHANIETVIFEDVDGGRTKVTNTSMFMTAEERDGMFGMMFGEDGKSGVHESYAALDRLLETLT
jgi:uncharacterized protein YndB with AHSA1/START domain